MFRAFWPRFVHGFASGYGRSVARKGLRIYTYHGVVENKTCHTLERNFHLAADFRQHVDFFKRCRTVGVDELVERLSARATFADPAVVITFDDGYQNNHIAADILDKARLPWTVFVSTGAINEASTIWTVELSLLILHGRTTTLDYGRAWRLGTKRERHLAFQTIRHQLKSVSTVERLRALQDIRDQFPLGHLWELLDQFPSMRMMSWNSVRQLASNGVVVGSHGVDHELHHANQTESDCLRELKESKHMLEAILGGACQYFAFPNGDIRLDSPQMLAECGYRLGFTTLASSVFTEYDPYRLPRLEPRSDLSRLVRDYFWNLPSRSPR